MLLPPKENSIFYILGFILSKKYGRHVFFGQNLQLLPHMDKLYNAVDYLVVFFGGGALARNFLQARIFTSTFVARKSPKAL